MPIKIVFFLMHVSSLSSQFRFAPDIQYFLNFLFLNNLHEIDTNVMMILYPQVSVEKVEGELIVGFSFFGLY